MSAACRNRCEGDVAVLSEAVVRTRAFHKMNTEALRWFGPAFMGLGLLMLAGALVVTLKTNKPDFAAIICGALFVLFGVMFRIFYRRSTGT